MQIRRMEPTDHEAVISLYGKVFGEVPWSEQWSQANIQRQLNQMHIDWWIALSKSKLLGFVAGGLTSAGVLSKQFNFSVQCPPDIQLCYLAELGTSPNHRRQGIGRQLTRHFLEVARKRGADAFCVRTRPGTGNHPWYEDSPDLSHWQCYPDGRILYGCTGLPRL